MHCLDCGASLVKCNLASQARQDSYQKQLEALAKQQQAANALLTTKHSGGTSGSSGTDSLT